MIYVISKATFGSYDVRDIQCNANWCSCPYSDYALIPEALVDGILATQGYCDITLNEDGTEVISFTAREIPSVPEECHGTNTVLSVNGVKADASGEITLSASNIGAAVCLEYMTSIPVAKWSDYGDVKRGTISVDGILVTDSPIIDVRLTGTEASVESDLVLDEEWGKIYRAAATKGAITLYAREMPDVELPIKIKVVR